MFGLFQKKNRSYAIAEALMEKTEAGLDAIFAATLFAELEALEDQSDFIEAHEAARKETVDALSKFVAALDRCGVSRAAVAYSVTSFVAQAFASVACNYHMPRDVAAMMILAAIDSREDVKP